MELQNIGIKAFLDLAKFPLDLKFCIIFGFHKIFLLFIELFLYNMKNDSRTRKNVAGFELVIVRTEIKNACHRQKNFWISNSFYVKSFN